MVMVIALPDGLTDVEKLAEVERRKKRLLEIRREMLELMGYGTWGDLVDTEYMLRHPGLPWRRA
jgi:hypothetical protein